MNKSAKAQKSSLAHLTSELKIWPQNSKSLTAALKQRTRWSEIHVFFKCYFIFRNCMFAGKKITHTHKHLDFWFAVETQGIW